MVTVALAQGRVGEPLAEQVDEGVGERMQLDAERVGAVARARQAVEGEAVLDLIDVALGDAAAVVPGEHVPGLAGPVGDDIAGARRQRAAR